MKIVSNKISLAELRRISQKSFGDLVKAVVDVEKEIMAIDSEFHSDEEAVLLKKGSKQENLWGINLYPDKTERGFIEYDSMINLRPAHGNKTRSVDDPQIRNKIIEIVNKLVTA